MDSEKDASDYILFSQRDNCSWEVNEYYGNDEPEIASAYYYTDGEAKVDGTTIKVTDVQVLNCVDNLKKDAFNTGEDYFNYDKIVGKNGRLKKYVREKISYGDGVNTPEREVAGTEKIQPKLVYVTAELNVGLSLKEHGEYQVPSLQLVKKSDGRIYKNDEGYNRPAYISNAFTDHMPCYFEESMGGKESWFAKIDGDKVTLHFAYLVDEDQVDGMALCLNDWVSSEEKLIYLDISQK